MKRYKLILTARQIGLITSALFEYAEVCQRDAEGRYHTVLNRLVKELDKIDSSIRRQMSKSHEPSKNKNLRSRSLKN